MVQLWVSLILLKSERLKNKGKQGSATEIPLTLPTPNFLISFQPAPQLKVTRTMERQKQETRRKNKIEQEKLKENSLVMRFTISIYSVSEWKPQ